MNDVIKEIAKKLIKGITKDIKRLEPVELLENNFVDYLIVCASGRKGFSRKSKNVGKRITYIKNGVINR